MVESSEWMRNLPAHIQERPLINLCIPGSHDSATWLLDRSGPIANDQPRWLRIISKLIPPVKRIVYNWSKCQSINVIQQLENGVRYLDIRLAYQEDKIYTVHGLCGQYLDWLLMDIDTFLRHHPKEIVLLDFNHFYNMGRMEHGRTLSRLLSIFGSRSCPTPPFTELHSLTLKTFWHYNWNIVVFYQIPFSLLVDIIKTIPIDQYENIQCPLPYLFWTSTFIRSPWPNTDRISLMINCIECCLDKKQTILPHGGFFVSQGVLTPSTKSVMMMPLSTLEEKMGIPGTLAVIDWLGRCGPGRISQLNILMVDFIEIGEFCRKVIALNV